MRRKVTPVISTAAKHLKELRETAGITQEQLGEAMRLSQKQVEALENGRKQISEELEIRWRRAVKRIAWARAVAVGAIPGSAAPPEFMVDTEVDLPTEE